MRFCLERGALSGRGRSAARAERSGHCRPSQRAALRSAPPAPPRPAPRRPVTSLTSQCGGRRRAPCRADWQRRTSARCGHAVPRRSGLSPGPTPPFCECRITERLRLKETLPIIELRPVPWAGCPPQPTHGLGRLRGRSARLCAVPRPHRSEYHTTCPSAGAAQGPLSPQCSLLPPVLHLIHQNPTSFTALLAARSVSPCAVGDCPNPGTALCATSC